MSTSAAAPAAPAFTAADAVAKYGDLDDDIAPVIAEMTAALEALERAALPLVHRLDEDTIATDFTPPEQGRIAIVCAYGALMTALWRCRLLGVGAKPTGEDVDLDDQRRAAIAATAKLATAAGSASSGADGAAAAPIGVSDVGELWSRLTRMDSYITKVRQGIVAEEGGEGGARRPGSRINKRFVKAVTTGAAGQKRDRDQ